MNNQHRRSISITLALFFALAMGAALLSSHAAAQSTRAWSTVGSTGTVDEDSTSLAQVRNFTITLQSLATGAVHVRYNITPTSGISRFCPATQSLIRVRFRNSDDAGTTAKVSFDIHSTNILSGGNNIVYSFTSNGRGAGGSFTTFTDAAAPVDFDFSNQVYWIDATVFRNNAALFADLGSIQISETAGTPCP